MNQVAIEFVKLHVFCDASINGTSVVYAVIYQECTEFQRLVASKARLSCRGLTIPRLELIWAHVATNLVDNVVTSLGEVEIRNVYGWCDSTTVLHRIMGNGSYKQFVSNIVNKMKTEVDIEWKYDITEMNPADIGSRGCGGSNLPIQRLKGHEWKWNEDQWPEQIEIKTSSELEVETKVIRDVLNVSVNSPDIFYSDLQKFEWWKFIRIMSWMNRFIWNCRNEKRNGSFTSDERYKLDKKSPT